MGLKGAYAKIQARAASRVSQANNLSSHCREGAPQSHNHNSSAASVSAVFATANSPHAAPCSEAPIRPAPRTACDLLALAGATIARPAALSL